MLHYARTLPEADLAAIADLERRVVGADGGRLKLEWGTLRTRGGERVQDLLWWDGGVLLGFLGLYSFSAPTELAGMVCPSARRRGIGSALLAAALAICRERGHRRVLLVVPGRSEAGRRFVLRYGGVLDHSEHALVLDGEPVAGSGELPVELRPAEPADAAEVSRLLAAGFGVDLGEPALGSGPDRTWLVVLEGAAVGTLRISRHGTEAGIYGFVVDPAWQGRGIGRDVLGRVCRQLRSDGARGVGLEVSVGNEHALRLYTSVGFTPVTTEDYYTVGTG